MKIRFVEAIPRGTMIHFCTVSAPFYSKTQYIFMLCNIFSRVTLYSEFLPTASRAKCIVLVEVSIVSVLDRC